MGEAEGHMRGELKGGFGLEDDDVKLEREAFGK